MRSLEDSWLWLRSLITLTAQDIIEKGLWHEVLKTSFLLADLKAHVNRSASYFRGTSITFKVSWHKKALCGEIKSCFFHFFWRQYVSVKCLSQGLGLHNWDNFFMNSHNLFSFLHIPLAHFEAELAEHLKFCLFEILRCENTLYWFNWCLKLELLTELGDRRHFSVIVLWGYAKT